MAKKSGHLATRVKLVLFTRNVGARFTNPFMERKENKNVYHSYYNYYFSIFVRHVCRTIGMVDYLSCLIQIRDLGNLVSSFLPKNRSAKKTSPFMERRENKSSKSSFRHILSLVCSIFLKGGSLCLS